jgi:hypothetical protein
MNPNEEEKFNQLYMKAMEERPEQFVSPSMPYVKCKVNGIEVLALIDSGSMITCTNLDLAERCGFVDEIDTRVKIPVVGVGNKVSIGQNYGVNIQFDDNEIIIPITIIDISLFDCDLIIGLDLFNSYRANINFQENKLILNSVNSIIKVDLLDETQKNKFVQIKRLIEISNNRLQEEEAVAYLEKNNNNFDTTVNEIISLL